MFKYQTLIKTAMALTLTLDRRKPRRRWIDSVIRNVVSQENRTNLRAVNYINGWVQIILLEKTLMDFKA